MLPAHHQTAARQSWQRKKNTVEHLAAIVTYFSQLDLVETKSELFQLCQGQGSVLCWSTVRSAHASQTNWTLKGLATVQIT